MAYVWTDNLRGVHHAVDGSGRVLAAVDERNGIVRACWMAHLPSVSLDFATLDGARAWVAQMYRHLEDT